MGRSAPERSVRWVTACGLRVGTIDVLLSSERIQPEDREQYRLFGIEPEQLNVLACKGINQFRADFEPIARKLVFVDTGGLVAVDFTRFPFRHVRRPIWQLDPVAALAPRLKGGGAAPGGCVRQCGCSPIIARASAGVAGSNPSSRMIRTARSVSCRFVAGSPFAK